MNFNIATNEKYKPGKAHKRGLVNLSFQDRLAFYNKRKATLEKIKTKVTENIEKAKKEVGLVRYVPFRDTLGKAKKYITSFIISVDKNKLLELIENLLNCLDIVKIVKDIFGEVFPNSKGVLVKFLKVGLGVIMKPFEILYMLVPIVHIVRGPSVEIRGRNLGIFVGKVIQLGMITVNKRKLQFIQIM